MWLESKVCPWNDDFWIPPGSKLNVLGFKKNEHEFVYALKSEVSIWSLKTGQLHYFDYLSFSAGKYWYIFLFGIWKKIISNS